MGTIPDDLGGIFAHLREAALTLQQGVHRWKAWAQMVRGR